MYLKQQHNKSYYNHLTILVNVNTPKQTKVGNVFHVCKLFLLFLQKQVLVIFSFNFSIIYYQYA